MLGSEYAENVTLVACVSAIGHAVPPMIIFKGSRMRSTYKDGMPPQSIVTMSPKGSITHDIFEQWLEHFARFKPTGKVLLIMDCAKYHLSLKIAEKAEQHDVILFCLPSNTTHELQHTDCISVVRTPLGCNCYDKLEQISRQTVKLGTVFRHSYIGLESQHDYPEYHQWLSSNRYLSVRQKCHT